MDMINIIKITNDKNLKKNLPTQFNKTEQISTVRSKIFNHKEFMKTLHTKDILDNINNLPCNITIYRSNPSAYCNWRHTYCPKHQIKQTALQDPIYREPVSINFLKCKTEIKNNLAKLSSNWCNEKGVPVKCFTQWTRTVMEKKSIKKLKNLNLVVNLSLVRLNNC